MSTPAHTPTVTCGFTSTTHVTANAIRRAMISQKKNRGSLYSQENELIPFSPGPFKPGINQHKRKKNGFKIKTTGVTTVIITLSQSVLIGLLTTVKNKEQ